MKIYIGEIPEIFGYGINVVGNTKAQCKTAMHREFQKQKGFVGKCYPLQEHFDTFNRAFEYFGGRIVEVEIGKAYFGSFGE